MNAFIPFSASNRPRRAILFFLLLMLGNLTAQAQNNWTGNTNRDWNTAGNWSAGIPTATSDVVIPSTPANQPVLSTAAVAKSVEVQAGASLSISNSGSLTLNGSKPIPIGVLNFTCTFLNDGSVNNSGQVVIGSSATASVGELGIRNNGTFANNTGGSIAIDRTTSTGLINVNGSFSNSATITIGAVASVGEQGILNQATFANNTGGSITIDQISLTGLINNRSFTNSAQITIRAGRTGISNGATNSTFQNTGCAALINIVADAYILNIGTFSNGGTIIENATGNSSISSNAGLVQNLNGGTFTITGTNTGLVTTIPGSLPVITATPSLTITQGQSTTLTASGAVSYSWSTGETTPAITVSATGPYSVTGTTGECSSKATVGMTVVPTFTVSNPAICPGQYVNLGNYVSNKSPITGDLTYYTSQANAQAGTNALISGLVGPVNSPITYYVRYDAAGSFSIQSIMVTFKPASPAPPVLTQSGHAYTGGVASVSVVQNSESVSLAVPGCDGTVSWSGPNNFISFSPTISVPTATTGSFTYQASCSSQTACYSGSSQATVTVNNVPNCGAGLSGPIWTGCASTDWNTAGNWASGTVPVATDDVVIPSGPANQPVIGSGTSAVGYSVEVQSGASLSIASGGSLTLNGSKNSNAFLNAGTVNNSGQVVIGNSPTASVGNCGIYNNGTFANNTGGSIAIDRVTGTSLFNTNATPSNFTNSAQITIGAVATGGFYGIVNQATFRNNAGGSIAIDRTTGSGLTNASGGSFTNVAQITIGAVAAVGQYGLDNSATFQNNTGGSIAIDRSSDGGLSNRGGRFTNAATITIGAVAAVGNFGVYNAASFTNTTGGTIRIDRSSVAGLYNLGGDSFINLATITIGASAAVGNSGIQNAATFQNTGCGALINIVADAIITNNATFSNTGTIIENASGNSSISSNAGLVQNLNGGTFTIGTNTGVLTTTPGTQPTITPSPSLTITQGQSATLTASGATSYSWSSGETTVAISVSVAGPYSVTGTIGSCSSVTTVTLTVNVPICGAGLSGPTWTGCVSTDWNTAGNWASGTVPVATDDVVIPSGPTNQPVLSTTATAKSVEVQTGASLSISSVGSLTINSFATLGGFPTAFYNQGTVTNNGTLMLGNTAPVGLIGLHNTGTFTNTGTLQIDRATNQGINNRVTATFTNTGLIAIGTVVSMGTQGIWNQASFANTGGTILIDRINGDGLLNSGNFVNSAAITIGASASVTGSGIANSGTFSNSACAILTVVAPINNSSNFTNAGLFTVSTIRFHSNTGTLTNNGLISYPQGNPISNVVNNDVVVAPISSCNAAFSPALLVGGNNAQFTVGTTWYTDQALTQAGGIYDQTTNTFTATGLAPGSSRTLYFTATDNANSCTRILSISVTASTIASLSIAANPSLTITQGQSTMLTASGATGYRWSTSETTADISVSVAGPYSVTGTTGGCSTTATVTVTVNAISPDYQPLVDLYNATNGPGWTSKTGWSPNTYSDPCTGNGGSPWFGVGCTNGRVTQLSLPRNQLSGSIPASLSALTNLQQLNLNNNRLSGNVLASLSALTNLTELNLNATNLSGEIPASLGALTTLTGLYLQNNQLSGSIPASLGALTNLQYLSLFLNNLSGSIPASLGALTNLTQLTLTFNQLSGTIPASLSALTNLQSLFLKNNQLSGCFPASLTALCSVPIKDFSFNPGLPGGGDFGAFCASGAGSDANAPQITTQPVASSAVAAGGSVRVVVGVSGTATGYQWYKDGGIVSGQVSATLTLPSVQASDAGSYLLVASGCSSVTSTAFTLMVNAPLPTITAGTATGTITACAGTVSTNTQSFLFSGSNLTATFVATAPTGFEVSTAPGSGFGASVTLNPSGGQAASGTIYVRSAATALAGAISGMVSLTSAGATTQNVAVSGMVTANPVVTIAANPSLTITQGNSTLLTASGGSSYNWSSGQSTSAISVSVAGPYSVTGTTGGCSSVTSVVVTVNPVQTGPFAITAVTTVSCTPILANRFSVSFTPRYDGLTGQPISFSVVNELLPTSEPVPYTLQLYTDNPVITLKATQTGTATPASFSYNWLAACQTSQAPNTPPTLVTPIANQTATAGTYFTFVIPDGTFTDAETPLSLKLSATGVPAGLSFSGATLSGVPSTTVGSPFLVSITATDPGNLSVSTPLLLTVLPATSTPPPTQPFAITGVTTISCTPVADRININFVPRYVGLNGQAVAFEVVNELAPTTDPAPYSLTLYRDNSVLVLKATQTGSVDQARFNYNWLAACASVGQDNTPPRVNSPVANQTATVGVGYSLNLSNTFADQETPNSLTLSASGLPDGLTLTGTLLSGTPSVSGASTVVLTATDPGSLSTSTSFVLTVSPVSSTTVTPSAVFSITGVQTVSCEVLSAGERKVTFTPQYTGLTGQPISFSVVNELLPTTASGPYSLNLYTDNPTINLRATQSGSPGEASFVYNWLSACGSGRQGVAEKADALSVVVLGNPVSSDQVLVEVRGVEGQSVRLQIVDGQGHRVSEQTHVSATNHDQYWLQLGSAGGIYYLQVITTYQRQRLKVVKQ